MVRLRKTLRARNVGSIYPILNPVPAKVIWNLDSAFESISLPSSLRPPANLMSVPSLPLTKSFIKLLNNTRKEFCGSKIAIYFY